MVEQAAGWVVWLGKEGMQAGMDGWMDGWVGGWMDGWMDGWINRLMVTLSRA